MRSKPKRPSNGFSREARGIGNSAINLCHFQGRLGKAPGFSLIELLLVVTVIAILVGLLLPSLKAAKAKAQGIGCTSNIKQMTAAWTMYALDHTDLVCMNIGAAAQADWESWVRGNLTLDFPPPNAGIYLAPDSTNRIYLQRSVLAPYLASSPNIWRCPADKSARTFNGYRFARTRSYSMNVSLGYYHPTRTLYVPSWVPGWAQDRVVRRVPDIRNPGPAGFFVFLDEREDSIHESKFTVHTDGMAPQNSGALKLTGFPGNYHNGNGNLGFADGRVESHKWIDPRTRPALVRDHDQPLDIYMKECLASPGNPDVQWLQQVAYQR